MSTARRRPWTTAAPRRTRSAAAAVLRRAGPWRVRQLLRTPAAGGCRRPGRGARCPCSGPSTAASSARAQTMRWQRKLVRVLLVLDLVAACCGSVVALLVRFGSDASTLYTVTTLVFPPVWLLACASTRSYELRFLGTGSEEFRRVFDAGVRLLAAVALVSLALQDRPRPHLRPAGLPADGRDSVCCCATPARQALHRLRGDGPLPAPGRRRRPRALLRRAGPPAAARAVRRLLGRRRLHRPHPGPRRRGRPGRRHLVLGHRGAPGAPTPTRSRSGRGPTSARPTCAGCPGSSRAPASRSSSPPR